MATKTKNEIVIDMAEEVQFTTEKDYIEDIINKIEAKKIFIDPRYQRRNSWNKENQLNFIDSIYKNMVSHSIILVNIGASYHIALQKNRHKDADYFKGLLDRGFEYISIDGNNRSQTITKYKNGEIKVKYSHDKDKSLFLKKKLTVTTYSSMSLLQMHELGIKVNQGQPWNRQEQRNCINSVVADTIREISTKFNTITDYISIKKSRMYVNLEPCSHHGKTPPCSDLIIRKEIPHVIIGAIDNHSKVAGKGIERLKNAGIRVEVGIEQEKCIELNKRFHKFHTEGLPYIILKWAQSKDGFISRTVRDIENGKSNWITGEKSIEYVHQQRACEQAILVGANTVKTDNPLLTTRGLDGKSPLRVIITSQPLENKNLNILKDNLPTLIFNKNFLAVYTTKKPTHYEPA